MTPSRMTEVPVMPLSQLVRPDGDGGQRTAEQQEHQQADDQRCDQRDDHHRHQAAEPARHVDSADPQCREAGDQAADDAADEAAADEDGDRARGEARCDAGPVGDREGDVAGQCRHQEPERQPAEGEQHRAEVLDEAAAGQVGQRVGGGDDDCRASSGRARRACWRCRSRRTGSPARSADRRRRRTGSCSSRRSAGSGGCGCPSRRRRRARRSAAAPAPRALDPGGVRIVGGGNALRRPSCRAR